MTSGAGVWLHRSRSGLVEYRRCPFHLAASPPVRDAAVAMEILFELVVEILGQVIFEFLLEGTFRRLARVLSNRIVRVVLGTGFAAAVGYGGGYWWGSRLTELGRTDPPRSLWASVGLAVLFITLAAVQALRRESRRGEAESRRGPLAEALAPWRWSVVRLLGFALLNAAAAVGIAAGFTPRQLR